MTRAGFGPAPGCEPGEDLSSEPKEGYQRVGVITQLPAVLRELGVDPEPVLAAAGVSGGMIADPEGALSFVEVDRLLETAIRAASCPHIGLLVGQRSTLRSLGLVGELMRHAPTVRRALQDLADNQHRYVRGAMVYIADYGDTVVVGYTVHHPGMEAGDALTDGAIAAGCQFLLDLGAGPPSEVMLPRAQPDQAGAYQRFLRAPVRFGSERAGIALTRAQVDRPVPGADPSRRQALEVAVRSYWATVEPSISHMVSRILRAHLMAGTATLDSAADALGLHPRTLRRRLESEGTSFRDLFKEVRFDLASRLLEGTGLPIAEIATSLGYSETSAFNHAFRHWAGITASTWRRKAGAGRARPRAS